MEVIFSHLKLWVAVAKHKCLKIKIEKLRIPGVYCAVVIQCFVTCSQQCSKPNTPVHRHILGQFIKRYYFIDNENGKQRFAKL